MHFLRFPKSKHTMFGFQSVVATAMVLASVEQLSDEERPGTNNEATGSGSDPKPKAVAKDAKSKAKAKGAPKAPKAVQKAAAKSAGSKASAKAKGPKTTKTTKTETEEPEELMEEAEEEDIVPKKKPSAKVDKGSDKTTKTKGLKRPAASSQPTEKKFSVCKYMYKNGKWGFKIRGKEVFGVTGLQRLPHHVISKYI